jgi:hypothetical protein
MEKMIFITSHLVMAICAFGVFSAGLGFSLKKRKAENKQPESVSAGQEFITMDIRLPEGKRELELSAN